MLLKKYYRVIITNMENIIVIVIIYFLHSFLQQVHSILLFIQNFEDFILGSKVLTALKIAVIWRPACGHFDS